MAPYDNQRKPGMSNGAWKGIAWVVVVYAIAGALYIMLRLVS